MYYKGKKSLVNLYPGASGKISQEELNSAEALMEYQFANTFDKIIRETPNASVENLIKSTGKIIDKEELELNSFVSPEDGFHLRIGSDEYFKILFDNKFKGH